MGRGLGRREGGDRGGREEGKQRWTRQTDGDEGWGTAKQNQRDRNKKKSRRSQREADGNGDLGSKRWESRKQNERDIGKNDTDRENQWDSNWARWGNREIQRERVREKKCVCVGGVCNTAGWPPNPKGHPDTCLPAHPPPATPTDPKRQVCGKGHICQHIMQMNS